MNQMPESCPADISDQDVLEAMKSIPGYLDITPANFRTIYLAAYRLALTGSTLNFGFNTLIQVPEQAEKSENALCPQIGFGSCGSA